MASLEKQSRLGCDMKSNSRLVRHMVKLAFDGQKWDLLNDIINVLSKKRSIIKFAIRNMVCSPIAYAPHLHFYLSDP